MRSGNRCARCVDCGVRHRPERGCVVPPSIDGRHAPGLGDGRYTKAPYWKKSSG